MNDRSGLTIIVRSLKSARIRIISPDEWGPPSDLVCVYDSEVTLVHELIHLHLDRWRGDAEERDHPDFDAKETAIETIARALVNLSRGTPR